MEQRQQQVVAVTPADQLLARLGVDLAEYIGDDVDPRMRRLAQADFTPPARSVDQIPGTHGPTTVWLDNETGDPVAYSPATNRDQPDEESLSGVRQGARATGSPISETGRAFTHSSVPTKDGWATRL